MNTFRTVSLILAAGVAASAAVLYGLVTAGDAREARKATREAATDREPLRPKDGPSPDLRRSSLQDLLLAQARPDEAATPQAQTTLDAPADDAARETLDGASSVHEPLDQKELVVRMDGGFDEEPRGSTWGREAERSARASLAPRLPRGSTLESLECRTKLCRVETFHQNVEALRTFLDDSFISRERSIWNGGFLSLVKEESDAGITAVTYIGKEGESVTMPDGPGAAAPR